MKEITLEQRMGVVQALAERSTIKELAGTAALLIDAGAQVLGDNPVDLARVVTNMIEEQHNEDPEGAEYFTERAEQAINEALSEAPGPAPQSEYSKGFSDGYRICMESVRRRLADYLTGDLIKMILGDEENYEKDKRYV